MVRLVAWVCSQRTLFIASWAMAALWVVGGSSCANRVWGDEPSAKSADGSKSLDFDADVLPALRKNCVACHRGAEPEGGVSLESAASIRKGYEGGALVVPGKAEESLLFRVAAALEKPTMPPADNKVGAAAFNATQLAALRGWIDQGAKGGTAGSVRIARRPLPKSVRPVLALAVSPDDELAACSRGPFLHVYDLRGPRLAATLADPALPAQDGVGTADADLVRSVAFDRTGNWLASGGYRTIRLWKRPQPERLRAGKIAAETAAGTRAVAITADGARFALGTESGRVELHSARGEPGNRAVKTLTESGAAIRALLFDAAGGRLLAAAADKSLRVWNVADGKLLGTWTGTIEPRSLALVASVAEAGKKADDAGKKEGAVKSETYDIAVGDADGAVRLWPLAIFNDGSPTETKELPAPRKELKGHGQPVISLAAAAGRLVSGGEDNVAKLWNVADGATLKSFGQDTPVLSVAISPDGRRVVTTGRRSARLWNSEDGALVTEIKADWRATRDAVRQDGSLTYARESAGYRKRDLQEAEEAVKRETAVVEGAKKAKEMAEKMVADKTEPAKKAVEARNAAEQKSKGATEAFAAIQERRTAIQKKTTDSDAAIKKLAADLEKAKAAADAKKDDKELADAAAKFDGELAAARAARKEAETELAAATEAYRAAEKAKVEAERVRGEAHSKAQQPERELKEAQNMLVGATNFVPTSEAILEKAKAKIQPAKDAVAAADALVVTMETEKKRIAEAASKESTAFHSAGFLNGGRTFGVMTQRGAVLLYDADRGAACGAIDSGLKDEKPNGGDEKSGETTSGGLAAISRGGTIAVVSPAGRVELWDAAKEWTLSRTVGGDVEPSAAAAPVDRVLSLDFHPNGALLASAGGSPGSEGELLLWRVADGGLERRIVTGSRDTLQCVRFSPDGTLLAAASADKSVRVFRVDDGKLVRTLAGHSQPVLAVAWPLDGGGLPGSGPAKNGPAGGGLVSGGTDQTIKWWNLESGAAVRTYRGTAYRIGEYRRAVTSLSFVGRTEHFVSSSGDGTVRLSRTGHDYDVRAVRERNVYFHAAGATSDGKLLLGGGHDGSLHAWHGESTYKQWTFRADAPGEMIKPN